MPRYCFAVATMLSGVSLRLSAHFSSYVGGGHIALASVGQQHLCVALHFLERNLAAFLVGGGGNAQYVPLDEVGNLLRLFVHTVANAAVAGCHDVFRSALVGLQLLPVHLDYSQIRAPGRIWLRAFHFQPVAFVSFYFHHNTHQLLRFKSRFIVGFESQTGGGESRHSVALSPCRRSGQHHQRA